MISGGRIRTLDGIRGIAIAMVLAGHAVARQPGLSPHARNWAEAFANAGVGVRLFFVLSGYLITSILVAEQTRTGTLSLSNFYLRRAIRIFPAFYAYLFVLIILNLAWNLGLDGRSLLAAGSFSWNYAALWQSPPPGAWYVGHLWTLAIEQQFYLIWPLAIATLGPDRSTLAAGALIAWCPLARVGTYILFPAQRGMTGMMFHTGIDSIMIGCVAALLVRRPRWAGCVQRHRGSLLLAALVWLALLSPLATLAVRGFGICAGFTMDATAAAVLVSCAHLAPSPRVLRVLGSGALPLVGTVSYSLYLWQQLFLGTSGPLGRIPIAGALALAFLAATASYLAIERPALNLRQVKRAPASRQTTEAVGPTA